MGCQVGAQRDAMDFFDPRFEVVSGIALEGGDDVHGLFVGHDWSLKGCAAIAAASCLRRPNLITTIDTLRSATTWLSSYEERTRWVRSQYVGSI